MYSLGIPKNSVLKYEQELKAGKFLLIYHGSKEERERVSKIVEVFQGEEEPAISNIG